MDVQPEHSDSELKRALPEGLALGAALPLLFSAARTGRLSARESDAPPLDVWIEEGRVVHAEWGRLRDLSALEMAALLPADFDVRFNDGERTSNRTLDLSAIDVASRLGEVSRAGGNLARAVPGVEAVPRQTGHRPRVIDPDTVRVLEQVDGTRTVADLVSGRQPLAVVRALANLAEQGAVTFMAAEIAPPPAPLQVVPPLAEEEVPASVGGDTPQAPRRFPVNIGLAVVALLMAVGLWVAVQRTQTSNLTVSGEAPTAATATQAAVAAAAPTTLPTSAPAAAPTSPPTTAPTTPPTTVPTAPPTAAPTTPPTAAPTSPPTAAPTTAPTSAPAVAPTSPPTAAPTTAPTSAPAVAPTSPPTAAPTTPPTAVPTLAAPATVPATPPSAPTQAPLLDETFATGDDGWPNAATSSTFWDTAGYHLVPRNAGQFVAITAPSRPSLTNGSVTALFRKLAGPVGGGYGLILRAQAPLDGSNQGGRYYVFEVGDRGEVGAWRREQEQWIDLQPWKASEAVHAGAAENRLQVVAAGPQFTFSVNDTPVAQVTDATLTSGNVGVFAGGDGNQVVLERLTVASN